MPARVLVVEDDPSWQEILVELLGDLGLTVRAAGSREQAILALDDGPFELALLDISLRGRDHDNQDGLRVLEHFRARYPHVPAVVLTGYATVDLAISSLTALGATDFLRKEQFDRRRFQETVRRVLGAQTAPGTERPVAGSAPPAGRDRAATANVLVVEDNPAWQSIYEELLAELPAGMALAVSYGEARGLLQRSRYDAAVVDLRLASSLAPDQNRDGFHILRLTHDAALTTIVVSALGQPQDIDRAYEEFGVFAFFDKEGFQRGIFLETLQDAIRRPGSTLPEGSGEGPVNDLTERQREVLVLLARGMTNNEIASELFVSVNTVKKHVLAIFATLGVNTRAAAAAVAARYGLR